MLPLFLSEYAAVLQGYYNITMPVHQRVICEKDARKQDWLRGQMPSLRDRSAHLVATMEELHATSAHDINDPEHTRKVILPHVFGKDAGVPCQSVVPLNKNAKANKGCVQRGEGTTGIGIAHAYGVIDGHSPEVVSWECSDKLSREDIEAASSDASWMVRQFDAKGYTAWYDSDNCTEWGSACDRWRAYWLALKLGHAPLEGTRQFFNNVRSGMKMKPRSLLSCITLDDEARSDEARKIGIPLYAQVSPKKEDSESGADVRWPVDHKAYFEKLGITWPLAESALQEAYSEIRVAGFSARQLQMVLV